MCQTRNGRLDLTAVRPTTSEGKEVHRHDGGTVEEKNGPMADWSDERLLEEYRSLSDRPGNADPAMPDKSAITEEILRRGLTLPETPIVPETETVDWSGEAGGEDPGSGALPTAF
jgi:hypothetical protein